MNKIVSLESFTVTGQTVKATKVFHYEQTALLNYSTNTHGRHTGSYDTQCMIYYNNIPSIFTTHIC